MKTSNAQCPFQVLVIRFAENLRVALGKLRAAESAVEFEMAKLHIEEILEEMEHSGA